MAKKEEISYLRRQHAASNGVSARRLWCPAELESLFPALAEYLCSVAHVDGTAREPSTLTICVDDGKLKGCVNDRSNEESLWRSADTLAELLACLDAALQDPRSSWRPWKKDFRANGKK